MYKIFVRPLLFLFAPEVIPLIHKIYAVNHSSLEREIFGITFKNPVGLAAGFDKDAILIDELATFGFGFIEIGTLTPKPQDGNPKPRLFRLPADQALINRMGFNNRGAAAAVERLRKRNSSIIVGGNIGKNKITPNEEAFADYAFCFETLYPYVDYFVLNVSSPNTPGLRELQEKEPLKKLLQGVKQLSAAKEKQKPVLLKIAPDLTTTQLDDVVEILVETRTDGVIATNTTISREGLVTDEKTVKEIGAGGLSGKPLSTRSTDVIKYLRAKLGSNFPIVGVGGIMNADDAIEKLNAGADLVQVYTGFIYEGPAIAKRIARKILKSRSNQD